MCGRYALSGDINELPAQFTRSVFNKEATRVDDNNYSINSETIILHNNLGGRNASYNIAPTQNSVIIYKQSDSFIFETSSFGLVPFWFKPKTNNLKEIRSTQSKYFNCRKETLIKGSSIWNSAKGKRCIIPIEGYFEWQKSNRVPYYVHSSKSKLIFLAGFYSHNNSIEPKNDEEYFSSFTVITGKAEKSDKNDISWLHDRKPIMLAPGTKQWDDWLGPDETTEKLINNCLETSKNIAYDSITMYPVTKDVGKVNSQGEYLVKEVKEEKSPQKSIDMFFRKRPVNSDPDCGSPKKIKKE